MNRNYCYGIDCDEERCTCHDAEIKEEMEMDMAIVDYKNSLAELKRVLDKLAESNKAKLEAIIKVEPFIKDLVNITKQ
jgi:cell fate (sporulation/competence/biofilm development) regulator YlbF (YheA/YmcA/DUF963 family)